MQYAEALSLDPLTTCANLCSSSYGAQVFRVSMLIVFRASVMLSWCVIVQVIPKLCGVLSTDLTAHSCIRLGLLCLWTMLVSIRHLIDSRVCGDWSNILACRDDEVQS